MVSNIIFQKNSTVWFLMGLHLNLKFAIYLKYYIYKCNQIDTNFHFQSWRHQFVNLRTHVIQSNL